MTLYIKMQLEGYLRDEGVLRLRDVDETRNRDGFVPSSTFILQLKGKGKKKRTGHLFEHVLLKEDDTLCDILLLSGLRPVAALFFFGWSERLLRFFDMD